MAYHRTDNYWEPTYDGKTQYGYLSEFNWQNLFSNNGPLKQICNWQNFDPSKHSSTTRSSYGKRKKIKKTIRQNRHLIEKTFYICDFIGDLSNITFKKCIFKSCYWNRCTWKNVKFQECIFERTSFSLARFEDCQFLDCNFSQIGISGNETRFTDCIVDPQKLVNAAYTNTDKTTLSKYHKKPAEQLMRLEETKAKLAKQINLHNNSYSEFFYSGIKVATLQTIKARIAKRKYVMKWYDIFIMMRIIGVCLEYLLWSTLGMLNGWGEKTIRVLVLGFALVSLFTFIYWHWNISLTFGQAFIRSFDISTVVGYSKICNASWIELLNLVLGMIWYSIAIPTVINKLTRTRY